MPESYEGTLKGPWGDPRGTLGESSGNLGGPSGELQGTLGVPRGHSGTLGVRSGTLGGAAGDPRGPSGPKIMKNNWLLIGFEKRTRGELGADLETRGVKRAPGRSKIGLEGGPRRPLGDTWDAMC